MISEPQQPTPRDILSLLTPAEQQMVQNTGEGGWGGSAILLLKKVLELFGQQRLEEVLLSCSLDVTGTWDSTEAVAGGRKFSRWGCSGVLVDSKVYIFGGRGLDNRTRGSMHVLDCAKVSISQLKTVNAPDARDGHSCLYYNGKLVLFGGCEGAEEEVTLFNRVHLLDLSTREWRELSPISSDFPTGRDGHAAAILDDLMVIYGGGTLQGVVGEVWGLQLTRGAWIRMEIEGDNPGPRESTSCVTIANAMYVFGGNVNPVQNADDIYSSDLYKMEVRNRTVVCTLIRPFMGSPPARLSCSMSVLSPTMLLIFGGESDHGMLRDVWVHHLTLNLWREIRPRSFIEGRIAHIGVAYGGKLIVFGGLDKESNARNEISILTLSISQAPKREYVYRPLQAPPRPATKPICKQCFHCPKICDQSLGLLFPTLHYMSRTLPQLPIISELCDHEPDWTSNFVRLIERLIASEATILHIRTVEESGRIKGKGDSLSQIIVWGNKGMGPKDMVANLVGVGKGVEKECRAIATQTVFVARNEEFITCLLLSEEASGFTQSLLVFDLLGVPLPTDSSSDSLSRILKAIPLSEITAVKVGVTVVLKMKKGIRGSEVLVPGSSGTKSLGEILKCFYFKPIDTNPEIYLNEDRIAHEYAAFTPYHRKEKHPKFSIRTLDVIESWPFALRLYFHNSLLAFKLSDTDKSSRRKRPCTSRPFDIIIADDSLIDPLTYTLVRSCETLDLMDAQGDEGPRKVRQGKE